MNLCEKKMSRPRGQDIGIFKTAGLRTGSRHLRISPWQGGGSVWRGP